MRFVLTAFCVAQLASCQSIEREPASAHPFIGCWESESGLSRESWTIDPSGWMVGYAINRNAKGDVTFYESMRIERGSGPDVFVVSGADGSTTRFAREEIDDPTIFRFVNAEHDFPQVITYRTSPGRLDADISLLDGSNRVEFLKSACED